MSIRYDAKGKYFTDVVSKVQMTAIIQTTTHQIQGIIYVQPDNRLLDELNCPLEFLPITDARVFDTDGEREVEFIAVSKDQIVWVSPLEDEIGGDNDER